MRRHDSHHRRGRVVNAACLAVAVGQYASRAGAQPEEPIVIGARQRLESLRLDHVDVALELFAQRVVDRTDSAGGGTLRDVEDLVRQTLELSTGGYVGRRELFDFDALGRLRLSEEFLDAETLNTDQRTVEILSEFDTRGTFFSESLLPITIFGRRDETILTRSFGGTLDATVTEFGARLDLRTDRTPMSLEYRRRVQSQEDDFNQTGFLARQHTLAYRGQWRPDDRSQLIWTYTLDFVNESGSLRPAESFVRQDGNITHFYRFGELNRHNLRSDLRFFQDTGDAEITRVRLSERLEMDHGPNLGSRFEYVLERQERPEFTQTLHRGTAYVEHQLFDSLTTIGEAGGEFLSSTDGDFTSRSGFGSLDLRYRKSAPKGMVFATVTGAIDYRDDSDRGGVVPVTDDTLTFDPGGLAAIIQRNIDAMSLVVTDPTGVITFIENVDFRVRQLGDRVELMLIPGGDLNAGDAVLADFTFTPDPANTTLTTSFNASLRYRFTETALRGLSPYVQYFRQAQARDSDGSLPLPESDVESILFGIEYDQPKLSFRAQREIRDSTLSPFNETLVEAQYTLSRGRRSALVIGARYDDIDRTDEDVRTRVSSLTARWNGRVTRGLSGDVLFILRRENDSAGTDSTSLEQRLNLTWRRGRTEIFGSVRNAFVNSGVTDTRSQVLLIGLRRSF